MNELFAYFGFWDPEEMSDLGLGVALAEKRPPKASDRTVHRIVMRWIPV
jgi:hypothetical protein